MRVFITGATHAARALGQIGTAEAVRALRGREGVEDDPWVREEVALALPAALHGPPAGRII